MGLPPDVENAATRLGGADLDGVLQDIEVDEVVVVPEAAFLPSVCM